MPQFARLLMLTVSSTAVGVAVGQQPHWAYDPLPKAVALPAVARADWCRNDLDRFVLARLERKQISPAPPLGAAQYLRRVSLSLTGLPPEAERLDRAEAGELDALIDELLASQRYAERMASEWLDVARYADTFGYQSDVERPVWPWRDWVLRAFRDNLPYDQFATWQIAGDLLPGATRDQQLATAFQRLHRQTNEGGSVEEEMRQEYVSDRTHTFATAFLGMTMECARCHDHKFDPVSQKEYYELSAFFDNVDESGLYSHFTRATPTPALSLPTPAPRRPATAHDGIATVLLTSGSSGTPKAVAHRLAAHLEVRLGQPVQLALLGQQVAARDLDRFVGLGMGAVEHICRRCQVFHARDIAVERGLVDH